MKTCVWDNARVQILKFWKKRFNVFSVVGSNDKPTLLHPAELACLQAGMKSTSQDFPASLADLVETEDQILKAWAALAADVDTTDLVCNMKPYNIG